MDYTELAAEFLDKMQSLRRAKPQKNINEAIQGESFVLQFISMQGDDVLPGEIKDEMDVSSARVAAALNSLEAKGLITREINKTDRRKILVKLTQEGKDLAEKHHYSVVGVVSKMLSLLGEHDAREYVRITAKLAELAPKCKDML